MSDDFGNRMKEYEFVETQRKFLPMLPIYARIDGRGFSKFTKGMKNPYDECMTASMIATAKYMVEQTHATLGYCQSDEISLIWYYPKYESGMLFERKVQKLVSVLAGMATAAFGQAVFDTFPDWSKYLARMPHFDARVIQLPNLDEAANMLLWRNIDATKNAISMAAHSEFSAKSLHKVNSAEMQERLFKDRGINFNDYPESFKRGTFVRRVVSERTLTEAELLRIPAKNRNAHTGMFTRSQVESISVPPFGKVINRVGFIFNDEKPVMRFEGL